MKLAIFKKIILFFALAVFLALPVSVFAQSEKALKPEENPLCWKKGDCQQARQNVLGSDAKAGAGWVQEAPCLNEWGKCLAAGATATTISLGGRRQFTDIGDYIKSVYNFSLVVISILAVLVIILSGVQWTASGGNAETISSAKKRIGGAVIGLVIAYMSYAILSSINPATVNLRLPQVWMTRAVPIPSKWCQDMQAFLNDPIFGVNEAFLNDYKGKSQPKAVAGGGKKQADTTCGIAFDIPGGSGSTCFGENCVGIAAGDKGETCDGNFPCACMLGNKYYECQPAAFGGDIILADRAKYVDEVELWAVCAREDSNKLSRAFYVQEEDTGETSKLYALAVSGGLKAAGEKVCQNFKLGYFALSVEVNDTDMSSVDDVWLIGKESCNGGRPVAGSNEATFWLMNDPAPVGFNSEKAAAFEKIKDKFWTPEEVANGVTCDLQISASSYPNLDDSDIEERGDGVYYYPQ